VRLLSRPSEKKSKFELWAARRSCMFFLSLLFFSLKIHPIPLRIPAIFMRTSSLHMAGLERWRRGTLLPKAEYSAALLCARRRCVLRWGVERQEGKSQRTARQQELKGRRAKPGKRPATEVPGGKKTIWRSSRPDTTLSLQRRDLQWRHMFREYFVEKMNGLKDKNVPIMRLSPSTKGAKGVTKREMKPNRVNFVTTWSRSLITTTPRRSSKGAIRCSAPRSLTSTHRTPPPGAKSLGCRSVATYQKKEGPA